MTDKDESTPNTWKVINNESDTQVHIGINGVMAEIAGWGNIVIWDSRYAARRT